MGQIALRGITWDHPRGLSPLLASVDAYARETGVHVEWQARSLKEFGDAPIETLARGYDLLIVGHPHVGVAADLECLIPLDSCLDAATLDTLSRQSAGPSHASYAYAGHQWALGIDAAMQASAFREDLLDAPLPASWTEVLTLAEQLHTVNRTVAMPLVPTDCICSFLSLCASMGEEAGRHADLVGDAIGHAALEWLVRFQAVAHPRCLAWNPIRMLDYMSRAADVVYCPLTFCYTNYARDGFAPHLLRFAEIPGTAGSILGGAGFAVSAYSAHPRAACGYGAWLCSGDVQRTLYVAYGGQPGNAVAWHDDAANALTHDFFRDTWRTIEQAYVRPRFAGFVTFQVAAGNTIHSLLKGDMTVAACFSRLRELFRQEYAG